MLLDSVLPVDLGSGRQGCISAVHSPWFPALMAVVMMLRPNSLKSLQSLTTCPLPTESDIRPNKLLTWCQQQTEGYQHVHVTDLTTSWRSGLALCAIIHRFRPELM